MSNIDRAIYEIKKIEDLQKRDQWVNRIHPLVKLACTFLYIICLVSFGSYDFMGVLSMGLYPLAMFIVGELKFSDCLRRIRVVLPLVCLIGLFNPIFDKTPMLFFGIVVRAGFVSMLTLIMKGVFAVLASYILIAATPIDMICCALEMLHMPGILVTETLLIYRYIGLLLAEAERITAAYQLRAPGQKGVHFKVWGSLLGQMLLRSMDRAGDVYDSMSLRGFSGSFRHLRTRIRWRRTDTALLLLGCGLFICLRVFPLFEIVGSVFM